MPSTVDSDTLPDGSAQYASRSAALAARLKAPGPLETLLTPEGLSQFRARLGPGLPDIETRREVTAELLATHLREGAAEEAIDLPGWTQALVDQITAEYEADVAAVAEFPGVEFLWP